MKRALLVLVFVAFAAGCSKCGKASVAKTTPVERVIPRGVVAAVMVPSVGSFGQKLKIVEALKVTGFVAQLQGFNDGKAFGDALVNELGIDLRSSDALAKAGIDGSRGAAFAVLATSHAYLALPVNDEAKFHEAFAALVLRRLGAAAPAEVKVGELSVKTFSTRAGEPARAGYVIAKGYALITDGSGTGQLVGLASLTDSDALSGDRDYVLRLREMPAERDAVAWVPLGSPALFRGPVSAAMGAATLTSSGLAVVVDASWKDDGTKFGALNAQKGDDNLGYLPRDVFMVTRFNGEPAKLNPWVKQLFGNYVARAFDQGGFDLKSEVLDQLKPGAVMSLSLSEKPPMGGGMPALDIRQTNPFSFAHLSGVAQVKQPEVVVPTFEKIIAVAPKFGAQMELRTRDDGQKAILTSYAQGEGVHFAPKGDRVFFASPVERLDALVKSDGKAGPPVTGLTDDAISMVIDLRRLASSVRELPDSAWGLGGFAMKATTVRWLDATNDLKSIAVSASVKEKVVRVNARLDIGAP
ncbi:MAG: hypothetical protein ACO1OB_22335 [Archangium sp.]